MDGGRGDIGEGLLPALPAHIPLMMTASSHHHLPNLFCCLLNPVPGPVLGSTGDPRKAQTRLLLLGSFSVGLNWGRDRF